MPDTVHRLINECGVKDSVLILNQVFVLFTGMAGRVGFVGMESNEFRNRFHQFGHSGYFLKDGHADDDFMGDEWVPLLCGDGFCRPIDLRPIPGALDGLLSFLLNNSEPIKIVAYMTPPVYALLYVLALYHTSESQRLAAESTINFNERPELALLLATEAYRQSPTLAARAQLLTTVETQPNIKKLWRTDLPGGGNLAISPDGHFLAAGQVKPLEIWDMNLGREVTGLRLKDNEWVNSLAFSPDGHQFATLTYIPFYDYSEIRFWDTVSRREIPGVRKVFPDQNLKALAFRPTTETIAWAGPDHTITLWNLADGKIIEHLDVGHNASANIENVAFSGDGRILASASTDGDIILWDMVTRKVIANKIHEKALTGKLVFGVDDKVLGVISENPEKISLWNASKVTPINLPSEIKNQTTTSLTFGGSNLVAVGTTEGDIFVWSLADNASSVSPTVIHTGSPVLNVALNPDGKSIASTNTNGLVSFWDIDFDNHLSNYQGNVESVAFSPNGKLLATGGGICLEGKCEGQLHLWGVDSGRLIGRPRRSTGSVTVVERCTTTPA